MNNTVFYILFFTAVVVIEETPCFFPLEASAQMSLVESIGQGVALVILFSLGVQYGCCTT